MFRAIRLSKSDPTPLYIQLASELAALIHEDILQAGFKLPTIRLLSKQLAINRDTVVSAYKLLEQQGLVESYIGKGTYITSRKMLSDNFPLPPSMPKPHFCCSQLKFASSFFPTELCQELVKDIIDKEGWEAFSDPLFRHRHLLKQSICTFLENLGVESHFAQIKVTSSINEFLLSLFKFFPKSGICVENVRDLSLSCHLRSFGAKIHEIPLTSEGLDLDALEKCLRTGTISYIIVSSYLQNPTGICYTTENKQALLKLAADYDCYIIEDGTYCEFLSDDIHYMPLINMDTQNRVIYMYHFSKLYLPYMKYCFFVLPPSLNARLNDDMVCSFNERFLHYYLDSDVFEDLKATILHMTAHHYARLLSALSAAESPVALTSTCGGIFLWLQIKTTDKQQFLDYLSTQQLIIAPGQLFTSSASSSYIRLSIGELTDSDLEQIITILLAYKCQPVPVG